MLREDLSTVHLAPDQAQLGMKAVGAAARRREVEPPLLLGRACGCGYGGARSVGWAVLHRAGPPSSSSSHSPSSLVD